jgi:hypothetical protein
VCETRSFTREEFYELVWSAPATKLGVDLGCSDVMIGKICKTFDIPKPYSGYWAKLDNDKSPQVTPLPLNSNPDLQTIVFHKHEDFDSAVSEPPRELLYDEDILSILKKARLLGEVKVGDRLHNPHPLVVITKQRLDRLAAERHRRWSERDSHWLREGPPGLWIEVSDGLAKRALRIMDAFIKRIEQIGGRVEIEANRYNEHVHETVVKFGGEKLSVIRIREKHNQVRIKNEKAKCSWERNRTELIPSGLLLMDDGPSSHRSPLAADGKTKKLEDKLDGLIISLVKEAGEKRIRKREAEEAAKRQAELERILRQREEELIQRRESLKKLQNEEQSKVNQLWLHAESWQKSQLVRQYLDELCSVCAPGAVPLDSELTAYLKWGVKQADRLDPLRTSPYSILDETIEDDRTGFSEHHPRKPR